MSESNTTSPGYTHRNRQRVIRANFSYYPGFQELAHVGCKGIPNKFRLRGVGTQANLYPP